MSKWKINLRHLIENFHQSRLIHESPTLVGFIFGHKEEHIITNVFFHPITSNGNGLIQELETLLPPSVCFLGYVSTDEKVQLESLIEKLSINNDDLLYFSLAAKLLLDKNIAQILKSIENWENDEALLITEEVFMQCLINFSVKVDELSEALNIIETLKQETSELIFIHEESKSIFSPQSKSSSLSKIQKSNKKNYIAITLKENNGVVKNGSIDSSTVNLNSLIKVSPKATDIEIWSALTNQIKKLLNQVGDIYRKDQMVSKLHSNAFSLSGWPTLLNLVTFINNEEKQKEHRIHVHKLLNLPMDGARIRTTQSIKFDANDSNLLVSPHEGIKYSPIGQVSIVKGRYHYHHYMQDNFDDSGWGCAYRSFQTIWSWFNLQGYTDKPVPTHKEIQQCLHDIGDKPAKFVGSRQWIGSMELSFCLETMLGIQSRILTTNSGKDVVEHCRAILFHFDNNGAPIMIGGGQLAHTILGVDYNTKTGECKFLVLDPHYTGEENLNFILKKGWCAWKPLSFWNTKSFYNLMLPINPKTDV